MQGRIFTNFDRGSGASRSHRLPRQAVVRRLDHVLHRPVVALDLALALRLEGLRSRHQNVSRARDEIRLLPYRLHRSIPVRSSAPRSCRDRPAAGRSACSTSRMIFTFSDAVRLTSRLPRQGSSGSFLSTGSKNRSKLEIRETSQRALLDPGSAFDEIRS